MDYRFGDYTLDTERYELRRAGTLVELRPRCSRCWPTSSRIASAWSPSRSYRSSCGLSSSSARRRYTRTSGQRARQWEIPGKPNGSSTHFTGVAFASWQLSICLFMSSVRVLVHPSRAMPNPPTPPGSPVPSGLVVVPDDHERVESERPEATVVDAEHKVVTVLSAGLVEATTLAAQLGPEAMHRLMQACVATAQRVLPPYGGTLTHITGEGLMALFGAPLAEEDHARRAVLAAVALQQALQARQEGVSPSMPLSIGLHTGPVVVGALGAESPRLYTAVGETFELVNRLRQQAAPAGFSSVPLPSGWCRKRSR